MHNLIVAVLLQAAPFVVPPIVMPPPLGHVEHLYSSKMELMEKVAGPLTGNQRGCLWAWGGDNFVVNFAMLLPDAQSVLKYGPGLQAARTTFNNYGLIYCPETGQEKKQMLEIFKRMQTQAQSNSIANRIQLGMAYANGIGPVADLDVSGDALVVLTAASVAAATLPWLVVLPGFAKLVTQ